MKRIIAALMAAALLLPPSMAAAQSSSSIGYVALGDSVAAGIGLPGPETSAQGQACGRTGSAYPAKVAASLGTTVTNLACSGAHVQEGFTPEPEDNAVMGPQLDAALAGGVPELITMTAGANDMRWHRFVWYCAQRTERDCGSWSENGAMRVLRADLAVELRQMLETIESRSGGSPPRVLINGYYAPFAPRLACSETEGLSRADQSWLNSQASALNTTLRNATRGYSFAEFVPVSFRGHELCTAQPWIQGRSGAAPFHPTAQGQQAIANANVRAYR